MKKYIALCGICAMILLIPSVQATIATTAVDAVTSFVESTTVPEDLEVTIDIKPDTLSDNSKCKWVTCYITTPDDYTVHDIDSPSIMLGELYALDEFTGIVDLNDDGVKELMVKFDRTAVLLMIGGITGEVELTITGALIDGVTFFGVDTILIA